MTEEIRGEIAKSLNGFCLKHLGADREKKVAKWRRDLSRRLEIEIAGPPEN